MTDKQLFVFLNAIDACKKIEEFHTQIFCTGFPLQIKGKDVDHSTFNEAYDLAYKVLRELPKLKEGE